MNTHKLLVPSLRALAGALLSLTLATASSLHAQPSAPGGYVMSDGDNITFISAAVSDGGNGSAQRLTVPDGVSGTMTAADGVQAGINNSYTGDNDPTLDPTTTGTGAISSSNSAVNGGAVGVGVGASLTLGAVGAGQWVFTSNSAAGNGGAIYGDEGSQITVRNGNFTGNYASYIYLTGTGANPDTGFSGTVSGTTYGGNGGAISGTGSLIDIAGSVFTSNTAYGVGGAVYNTGTSVTTGAGSLTTVTSSTFIGNTAVSNGGGAIGVQNAGAVLHVSDAYFENNSAGNQGGAVFINGGVTADISNVTFKGNSVTGIGYAGTPSGGGAIGNNGGTVTITNAYFLNNSSTTNGGGLALYGTTGTALVQSSTFEGNKAVNGGGANANASTLGSMTIMNTLFLSNTATNSGGGYNVSSNNVATDIENSTFRNNYSAGFGGGIGVSGGGAANTWTLKNLLIQSNSAALGGGGFAITTGAIAPTIVSSTFDGNYSGSVGGAVAIALVNNSTFFANDVTFKNNVAAMSGGAYAYSGTFNNPLISATNVLFTSNTALNGNGGAIFFDTRSSVNVTSATFSNNYASGNGGAISNSDQHQGNIVLTDVSFIGNTAGGLGGALYKTIGSGVFSYTVNGLSIIAGNKAGGVSSGLYFNTGAASTSSFNIAAASSTLAMLDPMRVFGNGSYQTLINKDGLGTWAIGGDNIFSSSNRNGYTTFNVNAGTLHLYRAGEVIFSGNSVSTGNILFQSTNFSNTGPVNFSFTLGNGATPATLSVGGGNTINATINATTTVLSTSIITFNPNSILSFDLAGALTAGLGGPGSSLLSLSAATIALDNGAGAFNFNLDFATVATGSFNLLSTSGAYLQTLATADTGHTLLNSDLFTYGPGIATPDSITWGITGTTLWIDLVAAATGGGSGNIVSNWTGGPVTPGDILNLTPALGAPITLAAPITVAGMYVTGNQSYHISGESITTDANVGDFAGAPGNAATGKLVLGGSAASDGSTYTADDTTTFTGVLDLTKQTGSNAFTAGVDIYSGALRIANADQLGTTLSHLKFLGTLTTGTLIFAQDPVFDGGGNGDLRFTDSANGEMNVEDGVVTEYTNYYAADPATGTNGGVMNVAAGANFALTAAPTGQWLFTSNSASNAGGAIYNGGTMSITNADFNGNTAASDGAVANAGVMTIRSSTFENNTATTTGGAAGNGGTGNTTIIGSLFKNNSATTQGGAFFEAGGSYLTLDGVTFDSNTATGPTSGNTGGGGAIYVNGATLTGTNLTFENNTSSYGGGALGLSGASTIDITNALFVSNSSIGAAGNVGGGAIYASPNAAVIETITLTNVSFLDNISNNLGGALGAYNLSTGGINLNLNTTSGTTALIAGNRQSVTAADPANTGASNFLNIKTNNGGALVNITVNTDANSTLDMLDPMVVLSNTGATYRISTIKNGDGVWKLSGTSTFGTNGATTSTITFAANAGMVYLYREGEQVTDATTGNTYPAATGAIYLQGSGVPAATALQTITFGASSTIGVGGGNTIGINRSNGINNAGGLLTLEQGSHIAYDLSTYQDALGVDPAESTGAVIAGSGPALLTLTATTFAIDNGSSFNFGLNLANATTSGTYNLLHVRSDGTDTLVPNTLFGTLGAGDGATFDSTTYGSLFYDLIGLDTANYDYLFGITGNYLWLSITALGGGGPVIPGGNSVLTWTGATDGVWGNSNWKNATTPNLVFTPGDIVNLNDTALAPGATTTINVAESSTLSGMYVSGNQSYTITGAGITADANASTDLAGTGDAASGKLVLGQVANDDSSVTTTPFTGVLDLTKQTADNNFTAGVDIYSGALRISSTGQLGATLSNLNFLGTGTLIAAGDVTFDGGLDATLFPQHLAIGTNASVTIVADGAGAVFGIANSIFGVDTSVASSGAAITVGAGSSLVLAGINGGSILFESNTTMANGGAIATSGSYLKITNALFTGNSAGVGTNMDGGAIVNYGAGAVIDIASSTFTNNHSVRGGAFDNPSVANTSGTFTDVNFNNNSSSANGGVFFVNGGTQTYTFNNVVFQSNTSAGPWGGGVFMSTADNYTTFTFNGVLFDSNQSTTQNNTAGGGVMMNNGQNITITINSSTLSNNSSVGNGGGGAIVTVNNNTTINLNDVRLEKNSAGAAPGGAINSTSAGFVLTGTNVIFTSNTASNGGAIYLNAGTTTPNGGMSYNVSITGGTFSGNGAATSGGAIFATNGNTNTLYDTITLTDVSFLNNTAGASGGAISVSKAMSLTLNLNTTTGVSTFSDNTANGVSSAIWFDITQGQSADILNVNTAPGSTLDMRDTISGTIANNDSLAINKNGGGTWNLGLVSLSKAGANGNLGGTTGAAQPSITFNVNEGTLHLYAPGEVQTGGADVAAGSISFSPLAAAGAIANFTLASKATLSIGGANFIKNDSTNANSAITFALGSILAYDLANAPAGYGPDDGAGALLTLTGANLKLANTPTVPNFNLDFMTVATGSYNLLTSANLGALLTTAGVQSLLTNITYEDGILASAPDVGVDNNMLWVNFADLTLAGNNVITWTGATSGAWAAANWLAATGGTAANKGDIVNLADTDLAPGATTAINIAVTATIAGINASGNTSYTLTGAGIVADATIGTLNASPAATGKLILGATAALDGSTPPDYTTAFTGTLDLTALAANTFTNGIELNTGALRVSTNANLGIQNLNQFAFTGADGALIIAANGNVTFNGDAVTPAQNQLVIGNYTLDPGNPGYTDAAGFLATSAAIIAEPGAVFSINNSAAGAWTATFADLVNSATTTWNGSSGAAINVGPGSTLVLSGTLAGAGGGFLFQSNTSTNTGGAINIGAGATAFVDSATFIGNMSGPSAMNGGAISVGGTLTIANSYFSANEAGGGAAASGSSANGGAIAGPHASIYIYDSVFAGNLGNAGGAIFNNNDGIIFARSSTFTGNRAYNNNGGAIASQGVTNLDIADSDFLNNTAGGSGGAVQAGQGSYSFTNVLFQSNTSTSTAAATGGGAYFTSGNSSQTTFTNVNFIGNTASGIGGAILIANAQGTAPSLNIVADSGTSYFAGNTQNGAGAEYDTHNAIYYSYTSGNLTVSTTINVTSAGELAMFDSISGTLNANNLSLNIIKVGDGTWDLGGNSFIRKQGQSAGIFTSMTIAAGTLHLYRDGEASYAGNTVTTGNITMAGQNAATANALFFTVAPGATLSVGGGNSIKITADTGNGGNVTLAQGSFLEYNLATYDLVTGAVQEKGSGTPLLSLTAGGSLNLLNGAALNPTLVFDFDSALGLSGTFNLLQATQGASTNLLTSSLDFTTLLGTATYDGHDYSWMTSNGYTLDAGVDSNILWISLVQSTPTPPTPSAGNNILTWTGGAGDTWLTGNNWKTTTPATPATFQNGDIVNLDSTNPAADNTITLDATATVLAMNLSGSGSYAITGNGNIIADPNATSTILDDNPLTPAATGKLTLGANATDPAAAPDTSAASAFTGVLDLTGLTGDNQFLNGVDLNGGALRISATGQLGATLSGVTFAGGTLAIANSPVTFDSASGTDNRIVIAPDATGAINVETGATLTIKGNAGTDIHGAALYVNTGATFAAIAADPDALVFEGNSVADGYYAGAILNKGDMTLENVSLANNAGNYGGALYNNGTLALANATLTANSAEFGAALFNDARGVATLRNVTISGNTGTGADSMGAAIFNYGSLDIADSNFTNNTAVFGAGALMTQNGSLITIATSTFAGNSAEANAGGAIWISDSSALALASVTFTGNQITGAGTTGGGAIYIGDDALVSLTGSGVAFENNTSPTRGGALFAAMGAVTLTDATFTGNTAATQGGAIYQAAAATLTLAATIDASNTGNTAAAGGFLYQAAHATAAIDIASGATLTIGDALATDPAADTIASADATATLNKLGAGALVLNAANSAYLGAININAGSLLLGNPAATLNASAITAGDGVTPATFGGAGTVTAPTVTINAASSLQVGATHAAGDSTIETLRIDNTLNLAAGATLLTDIYNTPTGTDANLLSIGTLATGVPLAIDFNTVVQSGTYLLIQADNPFTAAATDLSTIATSVEGTLLPTGGRVTVSYITDTPTPTTATKLWMTMATENISGTWTGANGSTWNVTDENWLNAKDHVFYNGDAVTFNDPSAPNAAAHTVDITTAGVTAAGMVVDTAQGFTFTGGAITTSTLGTNLADTIGNPENADPAAVTGKLEILGAGLVVLANTAGAPNDFQNGITISAGTLQGTVDTLNTSAGTIANNGAIVFDQDTAASYTGTMGGSGALVKQANGNLTLTGITDYAGPTTVTAGILTLGNANQIAASTTITLAPNTTLITGANDQTLNQLNGDGNIDASSGGDLTLVNSSLTTFTGAISGPASVTKDGAGNLILTGANTFTGSLTINAGYISLGNSAAAGTIDPSALVTINSGGNLEFNHGPASLAMSNTFAGLGNIMQAGTGTITLTANSSGFAGVTDISAGALNLSGATLGNATSKIDIYTGAALSGNGAAGGNVDASSGNVTITPHDTTAPATAPQTLTIGGTLTLGAGSTLDYNIYTALTNDHLDVGAFTMAGTSTIALTSVNYTLLGSATYTLIASNTPLAPAVATSFATTLDGTPIASGVGHITFNYDIVGNNLLLDTLTHNMAAIVWDGTNGSAWQSGTANWKTTDTIFLNGDSVIFDDTRGTPAGTGTNVVTIAPANVTAAGMTINTTGIYTFNGAGSITTSTAAADTTLTAATDGASVNGMLTKQGTGLAILANTATNTFTNGILITAGTLQGDAATLNVGPAAAITNNATLVFSQTTNAAYAAPITGNGLLVKQAAGDLALTNATNTYTGGITVHAGALDLTAPTPIGAITIDNAAALNLTNLASTIGAATVNGTLKITDNAAYAITNPVTGAGLLDITTGAGNAITLDGVNATTFTGTISLGASKYTLGANLTHATLVLGSGNATTVATTPVTIGNLDIHGALLDFATTVPADTAAPGLITTTALTLGTGTIQVNIPAAATTAAGAQASLFAQASGTTLDKLIAATGPITGASTVNTNFTLLDQNGDNLAAHAQTADIVQGPATVATGTYNYSLDATGGLNVKYGLTALTIANGSTLTLQPAAGESGTFGATISGNNATLDIAGATPVTLGKTNDFAGAINVAANSGLIAGANNSLGAAANTLALADNATLNLAGNTQTLATVTAGASDTIALAGGALTLTGPLTAGANNAITLGGGTLSTTALTQGATSTLALAGGLLTDTGALTQGDGSTLTTGANGKLTAASIATGANSTLTEATGATITTGALTLGANSTADLATGALTVNGANALSTAAGSTLNIDGGALATAGGTIAGHLAGSNGTIAITAGNLAVTTSNPALAASTSIAPAAAATLSYVDSLGATAPIAIAGALNINNTTPGTLDNSLAGAGALNLNGTAPVTMDNANNNLAAAIAVNGPVTANNLAALGSGPITIGSTGALAYDAAGTLDNPITANGALTLNPGDGAMLVNSNVTGAGAMNLDGAIELNGANTVANINALDGANIVANTANSLGTENTNLTMTNAAITLMQDNTTLGNLTMNGPSVIGYDKNLAPGATMQVRSLKSDSNGAIIRLNANVAAGAIDKIAITTNNPADNTGAFGLDLNLTGPEPTYTGTEGIPLAFVDPAKLGAAARISGTGSSKAAGWFHYADWSADTAGDQGMNINFTQGGLTGGAKNIIAAATGAMPLSWFTELDTLVKRLGDLQIDPREKPGMDLWARAYAQRVNVNDKDTPVPFHETQYGTEVGIDYGGRPTGYGAATYVGAFVGYGGSTRDVDGINASGNMNSAYAGLYATFITPDGWYADLVGKYNHFKSTFSADTDGGNFSNDAFGASIEAGKRIELAGNWYVTPNAQAALVRVFGQDYTTNARKDISLAQTTSRQLRAGAEAGYKILTKAGQIWQPHVKAYLAQQWTNGGDISIVGDSGSPYVSMIKGFRVDLGAGVNWQILKSLQVYLDYDCAFGRDYTKPYGLNLGINYAW